MNTTAPKSSRWWVIYEDDLVAMLRRVESGEASDVVMLEFLANTDTEEVSTAVEMIKGGFRSESDATEWAIERGHEIIRVDSGPSAWFVVFRLGGDQ